MKTKLGDANKNIIKYLNSQSSKEMDMIKFSHEVVIITFALT